MILVNAENRIMGRLATFVAKKAIEGETVTVINAEKAIITGSKQNAMRKFKIRLDIHGKGNPEKGPKFSRMPDKVLRHSIRGMLPWRSSRGKEAFKRVQVYIGLPDSLEGKQFAEMPKAKEPKRFVQLGEICRLLGAKW